MLKMAQNIALNVLCASVLATSAVANDNMDELVGHWHGKSTCTGANGTQIYVATASIQKIDGEYISQNTFLTGRDGPSSINTGVGYSILTSREGSTVNGEMLGWIRKPTWATLDKETVFTSELIDGGSKLISVDPDSSCQIELTRSNIPSAGANSFPKALSGVHYVKFGFPKTTIVSTIGPFGAELIYEKASKKLHCHFALQVEGDNFKRVPIRPSKDCAEGAIGFKEHRGKWQLLYTNSDGKVIAQYLREAKKDSVALSGIASTVAAWHASRAEKQDLAAALTNGERNSSAFSGMGWTIGDIPLGFDFQTTMSAAQPPQILQKQTWVAKTTSVLDKPIAPHPEFKQSNFGVTDIRAVTDRFVVTPTHWHGGNMVKEVSRSVSSNKPELMPTEESLLKAVETKFGTPPNVERSTQLGWMTGYSTTHFVNYPIKNGKIINGPCFPLNTRFSGPFVKTVDAYEMAKSVIRQIETGNYCDGMLTVTYQIGKLKRLRSYQIIARDFLMDAKDYVNDIETKVRLLKEHTENLGDVAPKL